MSTLEGEMDKGCMRGGEIYLDAGFELCRKPIKLISLFSI